MAFFDDIGMRWLSLTTLACGGILRRHCYEVVFFDDIDCIDIDIDIDMKWYSLTTLTLGGIQ